MGCIPSLALGQDCPEAMQLAMLAQQVRPAELCRRHIPDSH
jgi:hypothetical protein